MTTQEKNIAIAEMLNWVYVKDGDIWNPNMLHDYSFTRTTDLKFHSDANWQFETLKFITKTYDAAWKLTSKFCQIHNHNNSFDCRCEVNCPENPLSDMFECLYQFSQYLKTIKYYKWNDNNNNYVAKVFINKTATYYKDGKVYASNKDWVQRETDIEITEKEFDKIINL